MGQFHSLTRLRSPSSLLTSSFPGYQSRTKTIDVNDPSLRKEFLPGNRGGGSITARAPLGLVNSAYNNCGDIWRISLNSGGIATLDYTLNDAGGQLKKLDVPLTI